MIRFCDKEVACILEKQLDRQQLLEYFMNGHRRDIVCVLDEKGKFTGSITYLSLLGREIEQSVNRDYMMLGNNNWKEGRKCLDRCIKQFGVEKLVPVTDKERNLLCFAYEDLEADQELRMLDELKEHKSAVGFRDIYPQYEHVTVHGCNELAYQFVCYLTEQNVSFRVTGDLWGKFDTLQNVCNKNNNETLDYKTLDIYSEGTYAKDDRIELRPSVSPEFECIDKIYEANILSGIIRDVDKKIEDVLKFLRGKLIAILGTEQDSLSAYDFLLANGIDICCFISNTNDKQLKIFGKHVMKRAEAEQIWDDLVFIQADKQYSSWGFGETNEYHCFGYERNKRFFMLKDYIELPDNGLKNVLKHWILHMSGKLVLMGDMHLCFAMCCALKKYVRKDAAIVFCDILDQYQEEDIEMQQIDAHNIQKRDFCMLLIPKFYGCDLDTQGKTNYRKETKKKYDEALKKYDITDALDYPFENVEWMRAENLFDYDSSSVELKPKRIILGAINSSSGNYLFSGILDDHPEIIKMRYLSLNYNLYSICVRLSLHPSYKILPLFWKLVKEMKGCYSRDELEFPDKDTFECSMKQLLSKKERFTSQEMFVIIQVAYAKMIGIEVKNISNMTIYWEPHNVPRNEVEYYAKWLDEMKDEGYILNIVRNAYMSSGTAVNWLEADRPVERMLYTLYYPLEERNKKKEFAHWKRIILKFENLKCEPEEELRSFCKRTGLLWSDSLLDVQFGRRSGFDIAPAYRTWEKYFSSFDRFRICLVKGPWQRKYGYPNVRSLDFNRRELQEMFLKKFRFEDNWEFADCELENEFLNWRRKLMNDILWDARRKDLLGE